MERVGSNQAVPVDTRIIVATNRNLHEEVAQGRFREDLYYRLNILECQLVALRHRREDIPMLAKRFLDEAGAARRRPQALRLDAAAQKCLEAYGWPGNIRELRNVIERTVLLCEKPEAGLEDLPESLRAPAPAPHASHEPLASLEDLERGHIGRVLATEANQERAAEILGITTVTLWRKRKLYGLP